MNKILFYILIIASLLIFLAALWYWHEFYYPVSKTQACQSGVPMSVTEIFNAPLQPIVRDTGYGDSLFTGKHPDIYSPVVGTLKSKKHGWKINLHYRVSLKYENTNYMLVSNGSWNDVQRVWLPPRFFYYVLRKSDGAIIRKYAFKLNITRTEIIDDVFYAMEGYDPSRVFCMTVGE